ncbi:hypothetical protein F441_00266, partial [Phytophthora nicotianae CJ01A1]
VERRSHLERRGSPELLSTPTSSGQGIQGPRATHPVHKPNEGHHLSVDAGQQNAAISSDRIIVENWFGRTCTLWRICADKHRRRKDLYDDILQTCAAITNIHYPLHSTNGDEHRQLQNRLILHQYITNGQQLVLMLWETNYSKKRKLAPINHIP